MIDISLVVCTRNRAKYLPEALPYMNALKASAPWEIVFVDNGSTDATPEVLAEVARKDPEHTVVIKQPKPGLSAARNAGWHAARGRLLAFTDDDCYPRPDYLEMVRSCFTEPDIGFLGGRILLYDDADYPVTIQPHAQRVEIPPRTFVRPGLLHGANFAIRRDVLEAIGDFDERLGAGTVLNGGEDLDIFARACAAGYRGVYDPRPLVYHHHRRQQPEEVARLMEGYDFGRGAYYAKGLFARRSWSIFLWPVIRHALANLSLGEFGAMKREWLGAWRYFRR